MNSIRFQYTDTRTEEQKKQMKKFMGAEQSSDFTYETAVEKLKKKMIPSPKEFMKWFNSKRNI